MRGKTGGILDRYLFKSLLLPFLACLGGFIFVFLIAEVQDDLSDIIPLKSASLVATYFICTIPEKLSLVLPMALLLGTMYCFSVLNRNYEVTAVRAAGISMARFALPIYVLATAACIFVYINSQYLEPRLSQRAFELRNQAESTNTRSEQLNYSIFNKQGQRIDFSMFAHGKEYTSICINWYDKKNGVQRVIVAARGSHDRLLGWTLEQAQDNKVHDNQRTQKLVRKSLSLSEFREDPYTLNKLNGKVGVSKTADDLDKQLNSGRPLSSSMRNTLKTRYYDSFFSPLSCLIAALLGVALSVSGSRRIALSQALAALVIFVIYICSQQLSLWMGESGTLPPLLAAALAPCAFLGYGIHKTRNL